MTQQFELRLIGADTPDGEVRLADLAALAESLQELSRRIGRELAHEPGPGRTHQSVEAMTEMRLSALFEGSTRLRISRGGKDELALDLAEDVQIERRFWEVVDGVRTNDRPAWVTSLIAESAGKVVTAPTEAAPEIQFVRSDTESVSLMTQTLRREVWRNRNEVRQTVSVTITGTLEAVDLRSHQFRIADDVGNRIRLRDVPQADDVAHRINKRVRAAGAAVRGSQDRLQAIIEPTLEAAPIPDAWMPGSEVDWSQELAKPGPDPDGGVDVSDEEFDEFIGLLRS